MDELPDLSANAWDTRYRGGQTPWNLLGPTPEFARLLPSLGKPGRALVPGGGHGHDAVLLAKNGWETDLVDFSATALAEALALANSEKATVFAYRVDFFDLAALPYHRGVYDLFLEYTFFCAIDPKRRPDYAKAAAALLKPGAKFVGLFFPLSTDKPGPPFVVSEEEVRRLFSPYFELKIEQPQVSVKPRAGREFLGLFTRR